MIGFVLMLSSLVAQETVKPPNDRPAEAHPLAAGFHPAAPSPLFTTAGATSTVGRQDAAPGVGPDVFFLYEARAARSVAMTAEPPPADAATSRPASVPATRRTTASPAMRGSVMVYDATAFASTETGALVTASGDLASSSVRVEWDSRLGRKYLIRVAAAPDATTGPFRLAVGPMAEARSFGVGCSGDAKRIPTLSATPPRPGFATTIEIRGFAPRRRGALFSARVGGRPLDAGTLRPTLKPCRVHLDADSLVVLAEFATDSDGHARVSYLVPSISELLGVESELQAAVRIGDDLELTNGLSLRFGL